MQFFRERSKLQILGHLPSEHDGCHWKETENLPEIELICVYVSLHLQVRACRSGDTDIFDRSQSR